MSSDYYIMPMQLLAPSAVSTAVITLANICKPNFTISFFVIAFLLY